jgi:hypothetical protein
MTKTVIILTQQHDAHPPPIEEELRRRDVAFVRFDLGDFPEQLRLAAEAGDDGSGWHGTLTTQAQTILLEDIVSVWWRRPRSYVAPSQYAAPMRAFIEQEAYRGFLGILMGNVSAKRPFWVSPRDRIQATECKPAQLAAARSLGFRIPRTLITSDPVAAQQFYDRCHGNVVCKVVAQGLLDRQVPPQEARFMYTSRLEPEHLALLESVRVTATLFQEQIAKALELRVVVMGRQVFAVEIYSQNHKSTSLDWRRSYRELSYGIHRLPHEVEQQVLSLVRLFGLQYSSMDFILTPEGEYVFLEMNGAGQFYWLEPKTGLKLAAAMANLLTEPEEYGLW